MTPPRTPPAPPRLADLLGLGVVFGLAAGVLEPLVLHSKISSASEGRLMLGDHLWWMPAAAQIALMSLVALLGWSLARRWPGKVTLPILVGVLTGLAVLSPLRLLDGLLGVWTVNLIVLGLAVRGGQWLGPKLAVRLTGIRRIAVAGIVTVPLVAGGIGLRHQRAEARAVAALPPARSGSPNVLLLVLDTVRAMSLSVYGYQRPTTPVLERLAARGVVFDRAISTAPWTRPSHASLFTGRWEHELTADHLVPLDGTYPTLAEQLAGVGYRTGGFVANLTHATPAAGIARGFAHYEAHLVTPAQVAVSAWFPGRLYKMLPRGGPLPEARINYVRKTADDINRAILAWVDRSPGRPFFAFANYMDAHDPYRPQPPFDTLFAEPAYPALPPTRAGGPGLDRPREMRPYDQAIAYLDYEIGRLLDSLDARGLLANTVVIITSDHGEAFGEHGIYGHGSTLYMPMLHVPLLLAGPGGWPAGKRVEEWVSLQALAPTVMELAAPEVRQPFPGPSLTRFWRGDSIGAAPLLAGSRYAANNPAWYPTSKGTLHGLIAEGRLLVREADGRRELFDLASDPLQYTDLLLRNPGDPLAGRLASQLTALVGPVVPHPGWRPAR
ncbi:MAG: sulfatase [Gemmatimonadota bacterium]|nr:sulfatase [Gemmatimonadota bacterium]